jgi:hypothetical protein
MENKDERDEKKIRNDESTLAGEAQSKVLILSESDSED